MLKLTIVSVEKYDEEKEEFSNSKEYTINLEHSLVSLSKWESKWNKPFLSTDKKTFEETIDYIRCMTLTQNVDPEAYDYISQDNIKEVHNYIAALMTATTFVNEDKPPKHEIITSEILYYQMISLNIPFECQKWHLNRLLTLIRVCSIKVNPQRREVREKS